MTCGGVCGLGRRIGFCKAVLVEVDVTKFCKGYLGVA